jgi:uncharacterized protein YciI
MKNIAALIVLCLVASVSFCQKTNPNFDSALAKKYNADEYGMKKYILVILKTGSKNTENKKLRDSLFAGHMDNINRLVKINKLVVAGPLGKNDKTYRGIFILDVKTIEEATLLLQTDPAVKAELLAAELFEWYGSAALPAYLDASEKVGRNSF